MELLISFDGRIGRRAFWGGMAIVVACATLAMILLAPATSLSPAASAWSGFALSAALFWPVLALAVKRLRDRGREPMPTAAVYMAPGVVVNLMQGLGVGFVTRDVGGFFVSEATTLGVAALVIAFAVALAAFVDLALMPGRREAVAPPA